MFNYTLDYKYDRIREVLSDEDLGNIRHVIQFEKHAEYFSSGRTCYYKLQKPVMIHGIKYECLKIKGLGYGNVNGYWAFPGKSCFKRKEPHFGFNKNGIVIPAYSDDAPFGGIVFSKAQNEVNNFITLFDNAIVSLFPIALVKYNITFNGKPLACNIALCEDYPPIRMNRMLVDAHSLSGCEQSYFDKISALLGLAGYHSSLQFQIWTEIATKYANSIRKMNEAGLCLHSGGWSNIQFSLQQQQIVLIDMDSVRSLSSFPEQIRALYALRDIISNLYRFFINLYHPDTISLVTTDLLYQFEFPYYFLCGYFRNVPSDDLFKCSVKITRYYVHNCFTAIKAIEQKMLSLPSREQKKMELRMFGFYDYCFRLLYPLFLTEDTSTKNENTLSRYVGLSDK